MDSVATPNDIGDDIPLINESASLLPSKPISPYTATFIVKRLKALVLHLLPVQVDDSDITSPTSSIITPAVVEAVSRATGDYSDIVCYALLEARRSFTKDALRNPSDYDENMGRRLACEMLARKVIQKVDKERQHLVLSSRFSRIESDGDESLPISALESAVDQHCPVFLSSAEVQRCTFALWKGHLVQEIDFRGHVYYTIWRNAAGSSFLDHFDPARLGVPRYQNMFKIALWIVFLIAYSFALQTPDREFGVEDVVLYVQFFGYALEDVTRLWKIGSFEAFSFWSFLNLLVETLLAIAFGYRLADQFTTNGDLQRFYRLRSFQVLSCVAPFAWMKVLPVFETWPFIGTLQIVIFRMIRESAVFFVLLALMAIGFIQALTGLGALAPSASLAVDSLSIAAEEPTAATSVIQNLLQGLLGSPDFDQYTGAEASYPFGLILYYCWTFVTLIMLVNVLVALFGSAYSQVTDEAMSQYLAFFANKTVAAVRAPDQFVFVAPFNLFEILLLPLEFFISREAYARLNRTVLGLLFWPVLVLIALYEARVEAPKVRANKEDYLDEFGEEDYDENPEPDVRMDRIWWDRHEREHGSFESGTGSGVPTRGRVSSRLRLRASEVERAEREDGVGEGDDDLVDERKISTVSFDQLVKNFPDITKGSTTIIMGELGRIRKQLDEIESSVTGKAKTA